MIRRRGGDGFVAELLRDLPVPEHSDDFFERLRTRLYAENDDGMDTSDSTVIDLSVRRGDRRREQSRTQRLLRSATVPAAAAACFVLVVGGAQLARRTSDNHEGLTGHAVATARDFSSAKSQRFVVPKAYTPAATGLRVQFHTESVKNGVQAYDAVISPSGDYHLSRVSPRVEVNYSAQSGARTLYREDKGKPPEVVQQEGLPFGPPEPPDISNPIGTLSRDLGAAVRAIAAERPEDVKKSEWHGRPTLEVTDEVGGGALFQKQTLVVDEKTGIPIELTQWKADNSTYRTLKVDAITDVPLTAAALAPALPTASTNSHESRRFTTTTLGATAAAVGYQPLVPLWLPSGYALANVATAPLVDSIDGQTNPQYADVVTLVYRHGLDSFTVTTRRAVAGARQVTWSDPLLQGNPLPDRSETARVRSGVLAADTLHVGIAPVVWPHIWAQHGDLVVTIAGDLNRKELLQVAESLQAYVQ